MNHSNAKSYFGQIRFGPTFSPTSEDVHRIAHLSVELFSHGVEECLQVFPPQRTELKPGQDYRLCLVQLDGNPNSSDCLHFVRQQQGILPGLPGLLIAWKEASDWLPHDGNDIVALQERNSSIPSLNLDADGGELHMMNWNCTSLGHLNGQYLLFFKEAG